MEKAFRKDGGEHLRNSIEKKIPSTSKEKTNRMVVVTHDMHDVD
jgi:hypothetical protein